MIKPSKIRAAYKQVEKENLRFRSYLKRTADPDELDQRFHDLHKELFSGYDCAACRNCCRKYAIDLDPLETERAAEYLNLSKEDFVRLFAEDAGSKSHKTQISGPPCVLLREGGICLIEGARPIDCREFPYTSRSEMITRLRGVMEYAEICPVAYEIVERLKRIYGYPGSLR